MEADLQGRLNRASPGSRIPNPDSFKETSMIDPRFVTTAFELPGCRTVRTLGVVRGIVVRSRSIAGTMRASLQTVIGGNITLYTQMCEKAREDAFQLMLEHAAQSGANA